MPAPHRQQDEQRAPHGWSVAQKLACLVALASACSDPPPTGPIDPNDVDADGVPNDVDLCPFASDPMQHDEDGDRIGDVCDNCPTVVNPLQQDTTEEDNLQQFPDHVGDVCDPQPGRGGTQIRALHTFAVDNTVAWIGGGWTIGNDVAHADGTARWQHGRTQSGGAVAAVAIFSSVEWRVEGEIYVMLDGDGISSGSKCAVQQGVEGGADQLVVEEIGVPGDPVTSSLGPIAPGMPVSLSVLRALDKAQHNGLIVCRAIFGETSRELRLVTDESVVGQYAFGSENATTEVSSVIVYAGPQPCPDPMSRACPR